MKRREFLKLTAAVLGSLFLPIPPVAIETSEQRYLRETTQHLIDMGFSPQEAAEYAHLFLALSENIAHWRPPGDVEALRALGVDVDLNDYPMIGKTNDVLIHY